MNRKSNGVNASRKKFADKEFIIPFVYMYTSTLFTI